MVRGGNGVAGAAGQVCALSVTGSEAASGATEFRAAPTRVSRGRLLALAAAHCLYFVEVERAVRSTELAVEVNPQTGKTMSVGNIGELLADIAGPDTARVAGLLNRWVPRLPSVTHRPIGSLVTIKQALDAAAATYCDRVLVVLMPRREANGRAGRVGEDVGARITTAQYAPMQRWSSSFGDMRNLMCLKSRYFWTSDGEDTAGSTASRTLANR